jgi:hypothetical protein
LVDEREELSFVEKGGKQMVARGKMEKGRECARETDGMPT